MAAAIFFTVAILFLNLLPASFWATKKADNLQTAYAIASSKLEVLRTEPFQSLTLGGLPPETERRNGTDFSLTIDIQEIPGRNPDLLRSVEVTVAWSEGSGPKEAKLQTYITAVRR